ncbi:hypothetical protein F2Q70_00009149 [Brassica cretica]|uniref:DUF223 domain-containing protein n=1 Tax=Brassica cretica TaxID=69181 RepID=A0A8S9LWM2_BRACR|nr:hypothetical protein F2Q70_00009149 [Brassica cretica]
MDWLKSLKSFIFAVHLHVQGKDNHHGGTDSLWLASPPIHQRRRLFSTRYESRLYYNNSSSWRPGVRHSTFESLRLGRSSQSIASGFLCLWDFLNFKKDREFVGITVLFLDENVNSVIHGFTPVGRANHYMLSLKAYSIVKVNRFEVAMCSSMYKITDHQFLIQFISLTIIDEVITSAPEINLQSKLDRSKFPSDCEHKPRTPRYGWTNSFCPGL